MANEDAVIDKIESDTRNKKLEWSVNKFPLDSLSKENRLLGKAYVAPFNGNYFRVYNFEYKHYTDYDEYNLSEDICLEIIDNLGKAKWTFSKNRKIFDIFELAKYYAEKIDDIFDQYLGDKK